MTLDRDTGLLRIKVEDDAEEVLRVKCLPGRWYDSKEDAWYVPVRPGLGDKIEAVFKTTMIADLVREYEADFMRKIAPRPITIAEAFSISAQDAGNIAVTHHFYTVHHGDMADWVKNHGRLETD